MAAVLLIALLIIGGGVFVLVTNVKVTRQDLIGTWAAGAPDDKSVRGELELDRTGAFVCTMGPPDAPPTVSLRGKWKFQFNPVTGHKLVLNPDAGTPAENNPWGNEAIWTFKSYDGDRRIMTLKTKEGAKTWHK